MIFYAHFPLFVNVIYERPYSLGYNIIYFSRVVTRAYSKYSTSEDIPKIAR